MDFLQLRYFKKVAELENMSRAAEELMVSQPSLSKVVKNLEGERKRQTVRLALL
jgi:DNA-binding transcriptional LysR family regulator